MLHHVGLGSGCGRFGFGGVDQWHSITIQGIAFGMEDKKADVLGENTMQILWTNDKVFVEDVVVLVCEK